MSVRPGAKMGSSATIDFGATCKESLGAAAAGSGPATVALGAVVSRDVTRVVSTVPCGTTGIVTTIVTVSGFLAWPAAIRLLLGRVEACGDDGALMAAPVAATPTAPTTAMPKVQSEIRRRRRWRRSRASTRAA